MQKVLVTDPTSSAKQLLEAEGQDGHGAQEVAKDQIEAESQTPLVGSQTTALWINRILTTPYSDKELTR
jgi:hypothetical protein